VANGKLYVGSTSRMVNVYGPRTVVPPSPNLALNKAATGSTPCIPAQGPASAVNGSYAQGLNDKFCSLVANAQLQVDLGAPFTVSRFIVEHAGAGGEDLSLNSVAFNIQVSTDGVTFTPVVSVTGNTLSITTHDMTPVAARYVKLQVTRPTQTGDPTTRIYELQVFDTSSYAPQDFSLSVSPASQTVIAGTGGTYTATSSALNGFDGAIAWSASGAPAGVTISFNPANVTGSGTSGMTVSAATSAPTGNFTITVVGASGNLQHTASVKLTIASGSTVSLSSAFNRVGIVSDNSTFASGLDGFGFAYSANLMGTTRTVGGVSFQIGPANVPNVVSNATVILPAGQFSTLNVLATAVNGAQASQAFTLTYTDGSTSQYTQSLSDWASPNGYAGEAVSPPFAYRDVRDGTRNNKTLHVYAYAFSLNSTKIVKSVTLPANGNVVVLAMNLASGFVSVPLSSVYNHNGLVSDGSTFAGGLDGFGFAYSANLMGASQIFGNSTFILGPPDVPNAVSGATIGLPAAQFSAVNLLAAGVNGNQPAQTFVVRYSDGTTSTFTQSLSDWSSPQGYSGETVFAKFAYRDVSNGTRSNRTFSVYAYSFALNTQKIVSSITLPAGTDAVILAITLQR
jgi:F5/8 type C domain